MGSTNDIANDPELSDLLSQIYTLASQLLREID
jgi:hypothetical protein